ncbi:MAG: hypothetical protein IPI34_03480 [bacterium]|nr:hypothetical protein [bacterium]
MSSRGSAFLVLLAAGLSIPFRAAVADTCLDYGDYIHWAAGAPLPAGEAGGVAVVDGFAYVADGAPGLVVVDVSDPLHPEIRGSVDTPHVAARLQVIGTLAYVADEDAGLQIVDVGDPDAPALRGRAAFTDAHDLAVAGGYAYVAVEGAGVAVVDVADPDHPLRVRTVDTPGYAYGVCVAGGRLYVADSWNGLLIYSLADPAAPSLLGGYDTGGAQDVVVLGALAWIADYDDGLVVLNVADPAAIAPVAARPQSLYARALAISPSGACFVACAGGLHVYDATDPAVPAFRGAVPVGDDARDLALAGDWAFVADDDWGLGVYAIPALATTTDLGATVATPGYAVTVAGVGGHIFLGSQDSGLQVFDVAVPDSPALLTILPLPGFPTDMVVRDGYAFVASYSGGLQIVDVADPASPVVAGSLIPPGNASAVCLYGGHAFLTANDSLRAVGVSDPAAPHQIAATRLAWGLAVAANIRGVFATAEDGLLRWYEFGAGGFTPHASVALPGRGTGVLIQDTLVYVSWGAGDHGGVSVLAANGATDELVPLADLMLPEYVERLTFDRGLLYAASGTGGVFVVDVHDPWHPTLVGNAARPPSDAKSTAVLGDHVYVADNLGGLVVVPRECLAYVPVFLADFAATPDGGSVALSWNVHVVGEAGEFRLEAATAGAGWTVPAIDEGGGLWRARDADARLGAGGVVTYTLRHRAGGGVWTELAQRSVQLATPAAPRLLDARPNPFNPRTTIPFVLDRAGAARLAIHDQAGRLVVVLADGPLAAGLHEFAWDGRDARGRAMPSGAYLARLATEGRVATGKLVLLR